MKAKSSIGLFNVLLGQGVREQRIGYRPSRAHSQDHVLPLLFFIPRKGRRTVRHEIARLLRSDASDKSWPGLSVGRERLPSQNGCYI